MSLPMPQLGHSCPHCHGALDAAGLRAEAEGDLATLILIRLPDIPANSRVKDTLERVLARAMHRRAARADESLGVRA